jgi:hypothetical protein
VYIFRVRFFCSPPLTDKPPLKTALHYGVVSFRQSSFLPTGEYQLAFRQLANILWPSKTFIRDYTMTKQKIYWQIAC